MSRPLRIAFLHPDLGLGGAERLVVDAAVELQRAGHLVTVFTAHHDPEACFDETRDGTLTVRCFGDFIPAHIGNHLRAPAAVARMSYVAMRLSLGSGPYDVIFCDLTAHIIPVLRAISSARIVFYCHFPDVFLTPNPADVLRWYRAPINRLEESGLAMADLVLVNSRFTLAAFRRAFPRLARVKPRMLHPGVDLGRYPADDGAAGFDSGTVMILSINRFTPSKNLGLAVHAMAELRGRLAPAEFDKLELVLAGGYDERLPQACETVNNLEAMIDALGLRRQVRIVRSPSESDRIAMLSRCRAVIYTPSDEHFGYGPIEAMAAGRPVVAVNAGGPAETMIDGVTGFVRPAEPRAFAEAVASLVADPSLASRMGLAGRNHVMTRFSRQNFGYRLNRYIQTVARGADAGVAA